MTAPRIYFAGVNQTHFCEWFTGRHVLESFADIRPVVERYRPTFASMALDCGAFTELTTGTPIDIHEYSAFLHQHGAFYEWRASLDAIGGGVAKNVANYDQLRRCGHDVMPTFHQGEPYSALTDYCKDAPRVGLGFNRPILRAREFLDSCFALIPSTVKVHGWAMTNYTDYPFASVDSTTWLHELKALRKISTTQGSDPLAHLIDSELIEIVVKRYERMSKRRVWDGQGAAPIGPLFPSEAA